MCCCAQPNVNGTPGVYSWDGKHFGTRPIDQPSVNATDSVLYDEPGRCGGLDAHCHHFTVVSQQFGGFALLVRHGGGDERISLGHRHTLINLLGTLDTAGRYWLIHNLFTVVKDAGLFARNDEAHAWRTAAAEGRIRTRKQRRINQIKVWIEPATVATQENRS